MTIQQKISRRTLIGGAAAAGVLATQTPHISAQAEFITIPDPVTELPTDDITFRWVDSGDAKAIFWRAFFEKYTEKHPNIQVDYQGLPWNEIQTVVPLGVQNGNAPDVFQIPLNVPPPLAHEQGWGAAFEDFIPNFDAIKSTFPTGSFVNGINVFDGKTYYVSITSNKRHGQLLLYNRPYLQEAGFDPQTEPFTWDTFREAARVLTEQGNGEYYGFIFEGGQTGRYAEFANNLSALSGHKKGVLTAGAPIDWTTGEFLFTAPEIKAAVELLLALRDDGSIFPGSASLNAPEARAFMPQGAAAMIIQGPWNITQWRNEAPDFDFGVAQTPISELLPEPTIHIAPGGSNGMWVYADSPYQAVAADILSYVCSLEGQIAWGKFVGVADSPMLPEAAAEAAGEDAEALKATELFEQEVRMAPDPRVRNPAAGAVYQAIEPVQPDYGTVLQGIFTDQIGDIDAALQGLQDAWNAELERAIGVAQAGGAEVTRDDFVFPNWDPTRDYSDEDYAAL